MQLLRVAMLQLMPTGSGAGNLEKGLRACERAKAMGADIALFPEMWSNGYHVDRDVNVLCRESVPGDGEWGIRFSEAARRLEMAIGVTMLEEYHPTPRNTLLLFDRFGNRVLTYAKVHTCDFDVERNLTRGDRFDTVDLDTASGSVKVGAMICYDREFPESARLLMLQGAELILVPNACPMEINRISQLRARAYENMCAVVTVNYPAGQPDCNGHSTAFDGIAYLPEVEGSRDTLIADAGEAETICIAEIPVDEIRRYRSMEVHGNAYRRPGMYAPLVSEEVNAPFLRSDARR